MKAYTEIPWSSGCNGNEVGYEGDGRSELVSAERSKKRESGECRGE